MLSFIKPYGSVKAPFLQRYGYGFVASSNQPKTELSLSNATLHPTLLPPFCQCEHPSSHGVSWTGELVHLEANPSRQTIKKKSLHLHLAQLPDPAHISTDPGWGSRRARWPMQCKNERRVNCWLEVVRCVTPQVRREFLRKNELCTEERDSCAVPQFWQWLVP